MRPKLAQKELVSTLTEPNNALNNWGNLTHPWKWKEEDCQVIILYFELYSFSFHLYFNFLPEISTPQKNKFPYEIAMNIHKLCILLDVCLALRCVSVYGHIHTWIHISFHTYINRYIRLYIFISIHTYICVILNQVLEITNFTTSFQG